MMIQADKVTLSGQTLGFGLAGPDGTIQTLINPDRFFPLASVAKLITAVGAAAHEPGGALNDWMMAAIRDHDREATAQLLEAAGGAGRINTWLRDAGFAHMRVHADNRDPEANAATPRTVLSFLHRLAAGGLITGPALDAVMTALARQSDPDGLLSGLGPGTAWHHMTGGMAGVCNDVGFLRSRAGTITCCAFVEGDPQGEWYELEQTLGRVGAAIKAQNP